MRASPLATASYFCACTQRSGGSYVHTTLTPRQGQPENNYDKDVFNGDIGNVERVDPVEQEVSIRFDARLVKYDYGELDEVSLAYAVSIHKSQGSEFPAVVIPLAMQHYMLLQLNLIYTGITRGKKLLVLVGQRKALGIGGRKSAAVPNKNNEQQTSVFSSPKSEP